MQGEKKVYISTGFRDHSINAIRAAWKEWDCLGEKMKLIEVKKKENCRICIVPKSLDTNVYGQRRSHLVRLLKNQLYIKRGLI